MFIWFEGWVYYRYDMLDARRVLLPGLCSIARRILRTSRRISYFLHRSECRWLPLEQMLMMMQMQMLMLMRSLTFEDYLRRVRLGILHARFVEVSGQVSCIGWWYSHNFERYFWSAILKRKFLHARVRDVRSFDNNEPAIQKIRWTQYRILILIRVSRFQDRCKCSTCYHI